ncbi:MAG: TrmH family RNA methyltransferase [Acidobacteriota bacterium]
MAPLPLTSLQNPLCKRVRKAAEGKDREAFLLEGRHLLTEALAAEWPLLAVLVRLDRWPEWSARLLSLEGEGRVFAVPERLVAKLATQPASEGLLALAARKGSPLPDLPSPRGYLYLDAVQDPVNVGILVRSARAFGLAGVFAGQGTADPFRGQALHRSAGAAFQIPVWPMKAQEFLAWSGQKGVALLAANARGEPLPNAARPQGSFALVLGNEGRGLSPELLERCVRRVAIPMVAGWDSLNVAVAGSILMAHFSGLRFPAL